MKTRGLFLSALMMGAVMVGCSNEEVVENKFQTPDGNEYFMAVNFFGSGAGSRAAEDYAAAEGDEATVNNAVFYFLDENGNSCADPYTHGALTLGESTHHADSDDKESTPIIVMKNPTATPASIVVLLNVPKDFVAANYTSLSALQGIAGDYVGNANGFVMSNSVYADASNNVIIGAPVSAENIYETKEDLQVGLENNSATAVPVHVERVLAKVKVVNNVAAEDVSETTIDLTSATEDGQTATTEDVAIKVTIDGWWLDNAKDQSYMVKNLNPSVFDATATWWNDAANLRSYWAESYASANLENGSWDSHVTTDIYCHENTGENPTQLVVAATLSVGEDEGTTLVRWRNTYYTEEGFKIAYINYFNSTNKYYYKTSEETYEIITADMIDFAVNTNEDDDVTAKDYEAIVTLNTEETIYTVTGEGESQVATEVAAETVNEALGSATVKYWNGGKTYYYVPINHLAASGENAIVRNHVYTLNLNSVAGLGTPVANPEKVIIPTKVEDDTLSYITASVYVLKWRTVSQEVALN